MGEAENKLKGNAKKLEGSLTGDKAKQAEGEAQRALGDAEQAAKHLGDEVKERKDKV